MRIASPSVTPSPLLSALPRSGMTVVVVMGLGQRARIAAALGGMGWDPSTPAAVVVGAATAAAWTWTGTLGQLGAVALPAAPTGEPAAPGLLVIGDVVTVAADVEARRQSAETEAAPPTTEVDVDTGATDEVEGDFDTRRAR